MFGRAADARGRDPCGVNGAGDGPLITDDQVLNSLVVVLVIGLAPMTLALVNMMP